MYLSLFLLYSCALVAGTLSIYYCLQIDRAYRTRFLKPLAGYVFLWTIWIFLYQVLEFIYENILGFNCSTLSPHVLIPSAQVAFVLQAGIFYLLVNSATFLPGTLRHVSMSAGLFLFCAMPLFWIKWVFLPAAATPLLTNGDRAVRQLFENHRISEREQEIIHLIFKGMSNKKIEDTLSISYHTVKNHIYNIFQKLGVQSRGQLINRILQTRDEAS